MTETATTTEVRFGLEALAVALDAHTDTQLAGALGVSRRTIVRWRARGGLDPWQADRAATAAELHPLNVWPTWPHQP